MLARAVNATSMHMLRTNKEFKEGLVKNAFEKLNSHVLLLLNMF